MSSEDALSEEPGGERVAASRYRLLSPLGEGGMGTVWRAEDKVLHREVAVKEVRAPGGLTGPEVERMYTRLEREAWAAARVVHPNVVTVHDVAVEEGRPWIVMELVRGQSLADLLQAAGPLTPQRAAAIGAEVLAALRAADEAGVLHRDVKPANVLMAKDGRVVLTDFGIATIEGSTALTMTGQVVGSPEFLAPERALGRPFGLASDLWSLGVLLYVVVEGSSPFRQNTPLSTLRAVVDAELPPPRRAGALAPVIEKLLCKDPDERLGAEQLADELRLIAADAPFRAEPPQQAPAPSTAVAGPTAAVAGPTAQPSAPHPVPEPAVPGTSTQPAGAPPAPVPPVAVVATHPQGTSPAHTPPFAQTSTQHQAAPPTPIPQVAYGAPQPAAAHPVPQPPVGQFGAQPAGMRPGQAPGPMEFGPPVGPSAPPPGGPGRKRRRTVFVAASTALVVLALAGTGYALMQNGDKDRQSAGDSAASASPKDQSPSASAEVRVTVNSSRRDYSGECPPSYLESPEFTATFSVQDVDHFPVNISYRWVSDNGKVTDPSWRTLSFSQGDGFIKRETVRLNTYAKKGEFKSALGVEIKTPVHIKSNVVPLSFTCD